MRVARNANEDDDEDDNDENESQVGSGERICARPARSRRPRGGPSGRHRRASTDSHRDTDTTEAHSQRQTHTHAHTYIHTQTRAKGAQSQRGSSFVVAHMRPKRSKIAADNERAHAYSAAAAAAHLSDAAQFN